jgi:hypothetical protein
MHLGLSGHPPAPAPLLLLPHRPCSHRPRHSGRHRRRLCLARLRRVVVVVLVLLWSSSPSSSLLVVVVVVRGKRWAGESGAQPHWPASVGIF